jgi:flagellar motor protein MotB
LQKWERMRELELELFHSRLFGYSKKEVVQAVSDLALQNQTELKRTENEISKFRLKNEKLKKQIEKMNQMLEHSDTPMHLFEFAEEKSEFLSIMYQNYLDQQMEYYASKSDQTMQLFGDKVAAIKEEMKLNQLTLERSLKLILQKNDDIDQNMEEISAKTPGSVPAKTADAIAEEKSESSIASSAEKSENQLGWADEPTELVEQMPDRSSVIEETEFEPKVGVSLDSEDFFLGSSLPSDKSVKQQPSLADFWGDISTSPLEDFEDSAVMEKESHVFGEYTVRAEGETTLETVGQEVSARKSNPVSRYIIGKIAGEDLYDLEGCLIIRKDEPITEQVVAEADEANKLSELIINMTISDVPTCSA